jgi:hypothetical protein
VDHATRVLVLKRGESLVSEPRALYRSSTPELHSREVRRLVRRHASGAIQLCFGWHMGCRTSRRTWEGESARSFGALALAVNPGPAGRTTGIATQPVSSEARDCSFQAGRNGTAPQ